MTETYALSDTSVEYATRKEIGLGLSGTMQSEENILESIME